MKVIANYREEIDSIDRELIALFEKRMDMARLVAEYKKENDMEIFHQAREREVINKCLEDLDNKEYEQYVIEFIKKVMDLSKKFQFNLIK